MHAILFDTDGTVTLRDLPLRTLLPEQDLLDGRARVNELLECTSARSFVTSDVAVWWSDTGEVNAVASRFIEQHRAGELRGKVLLASLNPKTNQLLPLDDQHLRSLPYVGVPVPVAAARPRRVLLLTSLSYPSPAAAMAELGELVDEAVRTSGRVFADLVSVDHRITTVDGAERGGGDTAVGYVASATVVFGGGKALSIPERRPSGLDRLLAGQGGSNA